MFVLSHFTSLSHFLLFPLFSLPSVSLTTFSVIHFLFSHFLSLYSRFLLCLSFPHFAIFSFPAFRLLFIYFNFPSPFFIISFIIFISTPFSSIRLSYLPLPPLLKLPFYLIFPLFQISLPPLYSFFFFLSLFLPLFGVTFISSFSFFSFPLLLPLFLLSLSFSSLFLLSTLYSPLLPFYSCHVFLFSFSSFFS